MMFEVSKKIKEDDMNLQLRPAVGVSVLIRKENKILLGKRKNSHGAGTWAPPGGHVELNEQPFETAKREVFEETGLHIKNLRDGPYTNDIFKKEKLHYITLYIIADYESGIAEVKEPEKCEAWEWYAWNDLPDNLFLPLENLLKKKFIL